MSLVLEFNKLLAELALIGCTKVLNTLLFNPFYIGAPKNKYVECQTICTFSTTFVVLQIYYIAL